jgi:hypothetical protein
MIMSLMDQLQKDYTDMKAGSPSGSFETVSDHMDVDIPATKSQDNSSDIEIIENINT